MMATTSIYEATKVSSEKDQIGFINAVKNHQESEVRSLISAGVDVNITDKSGHTGLIYAIENGNESMVDLLIHAGADVNVTDEYGGTALQIAASQCKERLIRVLINAGADVNRQSQHPYETAAVFSAVRSQEPLSLKALIDAGADINIQNGYGETPLFCAVSWYDESIVHILIKAGVNVNLTDKKGRTALFDAVKNGEESNVHILIKAGVNVNHTDEEGRTALFYAVKNEKESNVHILIKAGVNVNHTDNEGRTVLFDAVQSEFGFTQALINAEADVNIRDNEGRTPLFLAVGSDYFHDELGHMLIDKPIPCRENVLQTLIKDENASVNARDNYGRTPLFYAIMKSPEAAEYLLKNGARIDFKDNNNMEILSFFVEQCIKNCECTVSFFQPSEAFDLLCQQGLKPKDFVKTIINIVFCISPLACDLGCFEEFEIPTCNISKPLTTALNLLDDNNDNIKKKSIIKNVLELLEEQKSRFLTSRFFDLLYQLGANPDSTDSNGNTVLHYITYLPFSYEVLQETTVDICIKLEQLGVNFNIKNKKNQNPLLLCLSHLAQWMKFYFGEEDNLLFMNLMKAILKVCLFLIRHGTSVSNISNNDDTVLHLMLEISNCFFVFEREEKSALLQELKVLWHLILPGNIHVENRIQLVNRSNNELNTPLHLWAEIGHLLDDIYDNDFKGLLKEILKLLLDSGARLNHRNLKEETPLHRCRTWCAVNLLLDAGANPNAVDSTGNTALLAAARHWLFGHNDKFYPDVKEDPNAFWQNAIKKKLNPWVVNKQGESVLSILVHENKFILVNALVDVTCDGNHLESDDITATSLLNAICRDKSMQTHWKSNLVEKILKASKGQASLDEALRLCCKNMVEFGVYEKKIIKSEVYSTTGNEDKVEQPPSNKHKLDHSTMEEASTNTSEDWDSVHCKIAKLLLYHGADPNCCLEQAENCPPLKELLSNPINDIPKFIPWTSISEKYKDRLAKVARRQECKIDGTLWYHIDPIGSGSFGHVFAGINEKDGREVAIKRIEKLRMKRPECKQEVENLLSLVGCENIICYLSITEDEHFYYVMLELMEGELNSYLDDKKLLPIEVRVQLCKDVLVGVQFLHSQKILHRDLKPSNILYKTHPKLCLKIADFGLSRCIDSTSTCTTVYGSNVGTRCWIAPEVLKGKDHSTSSDIFSCGLVLHFILSTTRHPFSPVVCDNKSKAVLNNETERNVLNGKMEGWDSSLSPEATHLLKDMLDVDEKKPRVTAVEALKHPLFWSEEKKMGFLCAVGNQPEFQCPGAKRTTLTALETDLDSSVPTVVKHGSWNDSQYKHMPVIYTEMTTKRKSYDTKSVVELVRFIRNARAHVSDKGHMPTFQKLILDDFIFLEYFPSLVIEVFKSVKTHAWDQRKEIKCTINK